MTTEFDSFNASRLGGFIESPVGVRWAGASVVLIMMVMQDESFGAYGDWRNPELYADELAEYRSKSITLHNLGFEARPLFIQPMNPGEAEGNNITDVTGAGEPFPFSYYFQWDRPGTLALVLTALDSVIKRTVPFQFIGHPIVVMMAIDDSGSMMRTAVQPTVDNFINWAEAQDVYPHLVLEDKGSLSPAERFLKQMSNMIDDFTRDYT